MTEPKLAGQVTSSYTLPNYTAVVVQPSDTLSVGDNIALGSAGMPSEGIIPLAPGATQKAEACRKIIDLAMKHKAVQEVHVGDRIGMKVALPIVKGDKVYKIV